MTMTGFLLCSLAYTLVLVVTSKSIHDDWNGALSKRMCVIDFFKCQQATSLLDPTCRDKYVTCLMGKINGESSYYFHELVQKCWFEVATENTGYCQRLGRNSVDWSGCADLWNNCMTKFIRL